IILKGATLTAAQRDQLFTSSIETITDASGTYTKAGPLDLTPPVLTLSINDGQLLAGESAIVTFQFSEVVTGFALSDVTATHGQLSS
ncbi:Ig-like domain-containing protein, partial [Methylobacterium sp. Leaf465]|uniref:Ig-like domain-containing protein n=1 Tax=Methylobacterium sp. Leaf465 TaxID=1736385 RepID=UPI001AEBA836